MTDLQARGVWAMVQRNRDVYRKTWKTNFLPPLLEPLLFIVALGYGLGVFVQQVEGVRYPVFIAPAILCITMMQTAFFDNSDQDPDPASRSVEVTAFDGTFTSRVESMAIDITPVNDDPTVAAFCENLLELDGALWTFVEKEGVEPPATLASRWHEGTVHHVFDGGWFWIIPFDNAQGSENPLCSIGLTLDMRKYPHRGVPPQQEFEEIVARMVAADLG